jgi:predicted nucleic-acid-binding Zn-ribbon protein
MEHTMSSDAKEVRVAGRLLHCQICGHDHFTERETRLANGAATFDQNWANPRATCVICERCGYVHWFMPAPISDDTRDTALAEEIEALRRSLEEPAPDRDEVLSR